jgi:hypothetical protein
VPISLTMVQLRSCLLVLGCALLLPGLAAPRAQAKTCGAYTNQAAAQRGQDTRDADGDGIFCEALPCPCLLPGKAPARPRPATPSAPLLGRSITLGRPTRRAGCHVHGGLPDPRCTPGARFSRATRAEICRPGYASSVRNVSTATKDAVYGAYGLRRHFNGGDGEVDHLVSLELGGSNSVANLFPEAATPRPGSHEKDRLENALHRDVCDGGISLAHAQRLIASDWVAAYRARFG